MPREHLLRKDGGYKAARRETPRPRHRPRQRPDWPTTPMPEWTPPPKRRERFPKLKMALKVIGHLIMWPSILVLAQLTGLNVIGFLAAMGVFLAFVFVAAGIEEMWKMIRLGPKEWNRQRLAEKAMWEQSMANVERARLKRMREQAGEEEIRQIDREARAREFHKAVASRKKPQPKSGRLQVHKLLVD